MSKDMMIFNACNHKIDRVEYPALECPLCKGKGFYYDIAYEQRGRIVTCDNEIKLQQEILKILNDIKGGNPFHPNYGNNIYNVGFGRKNTDVMVQRIQVMIYDALQYLRGIQINNKVLFKNATDAELLEEINEINVVQLEPTRYQISIKFTSASGAVFSQSLIV